MTPRERLELLRHSSAVRGVWISWHRAAMRAGIAARDALPIADGIALFTRAIGDAKDGSRVIREAMDSLRGASPAPRPPLRGRPPRGTAIQEALGIESALRMRSEGRKLAEIVATLNDRGQHGDNRWNTNTLSKALSRRLKSTP